MPAPPNPTTLTTLLLLLLLPTLILTQRLVEKINTHPDSLDHRITPDSPKYISLYKPYEKLIIPSGYSVDASLSFIEVKLWLSLRDSYISFVTNTCQKCFAFQKKTIKSNNKKVLSDYQNKSLGSCQNVNQSCTQITTNGIVGQMVEQKFYFSRWTSGNISTLLITDIPEGHILSRREIDGVIGIGREDYDSSYGFGTMGELGKIYSIDNSVIEAHLTHGGYLVVGGFSLGNGAGSFVDCALENTFEYSCVLDGLFLYYEVTEGGLGGGDGNGGTGDYEMQTTMVEDRILTFGNGKKRFRMDTLEKFVYVEEVIWQRFIKELCDLLNSNNLVDVFLTDGAERNVENCVQNFTGNPEKRYIVNESNYRTFSGVKFGLLVKDIYVKDANIFGVCENSIDTDLDQKAKVYDFSYEGAAEKPKHGYEAWQRNVEICLAVLQSEAYGFNENVLGNAFLRNRVIRIDNKTPKFSFSMAANPTPPAQLENTDLDFQILPEKVWILLVEIILGVLFVFFIAINCDKLIGEI